MRVSSQNEWDVLTHMGTRLYALLPRLEPLATALMRRQQRALVLAGTCPRHERSATLRLVWHRPRPPHLQVVFQCHSGREWEGACAAGVGGALQEYKRRRALLTRHTRTCTIDINVSLALPTQVEARVTARGATDYVPSGDPAAFLATVLAVMRQQDRQRLAAWEARRRPAPGYGHRTLSLSPILAREEVIFALALVLAQEWGITKATVQQMQALLLTHFGVPASAVEAVWQGLHQHLVHPQTPLDLRAYIARCRGGSSAQDQAFWDPDTGEEYWPVARAAQDLGKHPATIRRWIAEGTLVAKRFTYQGRSGVQKTAQAVARDSVESQRQRQQFDDTAINLLRKAKKIPRAAAEQT